MKHESPLLHRSGEVNRCARWLRQKLKDGGLVASKIAIQGCSDFLKSLSPTVWVFMEQNHRGPYYWRLATARQGKLDEFVKKTPISGKDLVQCRGGKSKRVELRSLYFALSPNIPDKIWRNCRWDATPSDEDFTPSPSKGKKPSAAKTSKGVVKSMRPQHTAAHKKITGDLEEEEVIIVHTESESEQDCPVLGPSGPNQPQCPQVEVKLEPPAIYKSELLFLTNGSDVEHESDSSFHGIFSTRLRTITATPDVSGVSTSAWTLPAAIIAPPVLATASGPVPPYTCSCACARYCASSCSCSCTHACASSFDFNNHCNNARSFRLRSHLFCFGDIPSSGTALALTSSMPDLFDTYYTASMAAHDYFNQYGNLAEDSPQKHSLDTFLEGSSIISPRTIRNPWKRFKKY
ncbi:hypothetical protein C8J57DRAFT_437381 [Mycena rebaudengoi]|nr:hypothetical protein C8J57DRAFT_437381 [Mycena rebaudengoi]